MLLEKKAAGRPGKEAHEEAENNVAKFATLFASPPQANTRDQLAKKFGVSPRTIQNDGDFVEAMNRIEEVVGPEVRDKLASKGITRTHTELVELAKSLDGRGRSDVIPHWS